MKKLIIICSISAVLLSCKDDKNATDTIQETPPSDTLSTEVKVQDSATFDADVPKEKSMKAIKAELDALGYKTFDYEDPETKDTILMQQYFIAFLKTGPIRGQNEEEAEDLQKAHLAHLKKMYDLGYADISGPFGDDSAIRGITIYNVPTQKMADSLANADPMVKAGRLEIEIHPWWAAKGYALR